MDLPNAQMPSTGQRWADGQEVWPHRFPAQVSTRDGSYEVKGRQHSPNYRADGAQAGKVGASLCFGPLISLYISFPALKFEPDVFEFAAQYLQLSVG